MAGIADIYSGGDFSAGFAQTAQSAVRPNLEYQVNILQNAVIKRLNEKISAVNADKELKNSTLDAYLSSQKKKLSAFSFQTEKYIFDNGRNMITADALTTKLNDLSAALAANDTTTFNQVLKSINQVTDMMTQANGMPIGIVVDDGVSKIQSPGLVQYNNAGTQTRATQRSDFATDADATAAINQAFNELGTTSQVLSFNQDAAENLRSKTQGKLNSTILQLEAVRVANDAEKANEVEKLRRQYSQFLNAISLSYESNAALTEKLSSSLFGPLDIQPGSVMNLFA